MRSHRLRTVAVALAVLAGCGRAAGRQASVLPIGGASRATPNAVVTRVVDGDTIRARISGRQERVRFIGIDTPESVKPNALRLLVDCSTICTAGSPAPVVASLTLPLISKGPGVTFTFWFTF